MQHLLNSPAVILHYKPGVEKIKYIQRMFIQQFINSHKEVVRQFIYESSTILLTNND